MCPPVRGGDVDLPSSLVMVVLLPQAASSLGDCVYFVSSSATVGFICIFFNGRKRKKITP